MQSASTSVAAAPDSGERTSGLRRAWGWWSRRPTLAAAVIYAVLAVVMVGQGLVPGRTLSSSDGLLSSVPWQASKPADVPGLGTNFELADASNVFQPMLRYTRSQLPTVPLWNPYIMAGRPLLADGQSAVFSPFSVPSYVLPFWKSLAVAAMLKLFLGALGAFVLARVLGMRFGGALLTGVVFAFGTFFVVWLAWPLASVYAFIGWTLALTELLVRRPGRLPVAGLAAVVGLQFLGGHPESSFHLLFTASVFFVFRALWWRRRRAMAWRELSRPVAAYVLALAAGAGLAALVLAPFLEFVLHSGDLSPPAQRGRRVLAAQVPRGPVPARLLGPADAGRSGVVHAGPRLVRGRRHADAGRHRAARAPQRGAVGRGDLRGVLRVHGGRHPARVQHRQRAAGLQRRP